MHEKVPCPNRKAGHRPKPTQNKTIMTVLSFALGSDLFETTVREGYGRKKWTVWLSGQKLNKIANAPGHLGFFEVSSQIHIMEFPWTIYVPQPMSVIRFYCCIFEKTFFPQEKACFLQRDFMHILASFEQELQTWQEQLREWDPFETRKKKEQNIYATRTNK